MRECCGLYHNLVRPIGKKRRLNWGRIEIVKKTYYLAFPFFLKTEYCKILNKFTAKFKSATNWICLYRGDVTSLELRALPKQCITKLNLYKDHSEQVEAPMILWARFCHCSRISVSFFLHWLTSNVVCFFCWKAKVGNILCKRSFHELWKRKQSEQL